MHHHVDLILQFADTEGGPEDEYADENLEDRMDAVAGLCFKKSTGGKNTRERRRMNNPYSGSFPHNILIAPIAAASSPNNHPKTLQTGDAPLILISFS